MNGAQIDCGHSGASTHARPSGDGGEGWMSRLNRRRLGERVEFRFSGLRAVQVTFVCFSHCYALRVRRFGEAERSLVPLLECMHWEIFLGWGQESQLNIEPFEFGVYKKKCR